jgi:hypothetical protein
MFIQIIFKFKPYPTYNTIPLHYQDQLTNVQVRTVLYSENHMKAVMQIFLIVTIILQNSNTANTFLKMREGHLGANQQQFLRLP